MTLRCGTVPITSLSSPTTAQYFGAAGQIAAGGNTTTITTSQSIVDGLKSTIAQMLANSSYGVRPTAIYANPVLLDLIDREMKAEFNVVLNTKPIEGGIDGEDAEHAGGRYSADSGVDAAVYGHAWFGLGGAAGVHRDGGPDRVSLVGDPNPRVFQLGLPGSLASQYGVVKFGAVVVKGANYAHYQVLVDR